MYCPYFVDSFDPCKHIWAAILAADGARVFRGPSDVWLDTESEATDALDAGGLDQHRLEEDDKWRSKSRRPAHDPPPPAWRTFLEQVTPPASDTRPTRALPTGELIYVFDPACSATTGGLLIELMTRDRKKSGDWAKPRPLTLSRSDVARLPDERDRRILDAVCGAEQAYPSAGMFWDRYAVGLPVPSKFVLNLTLQRDLTPRFCDTGRLFLRVPPSPADSTSRDVTGSDRLGCRTRPIPRSHHRRRTHGIHHRWNV